MTLMSRLLPTLLMALVTLCGCGGTEIRGASGVCRTGEVLLIAGDKDPAGYFEAGIQAPEGSLLTLSPPIAWVALPTPELAVDLEGIDILSDGRVVVLSERNYCLVASDGLVVQYDETLGEVAGRGLEGVAVRTGDRGNSMIAVVWEGGYPRPVKGLSSNVVDTFPMLPFVVTHPLEAGRAGMIHELEDYPATPLHVPLPEGDEPEAQRFRATDLVWHRLSQDTWGFIVLLSSEDLVDEPAYHHRWLQRFDTEGEPVGEPLDIELGLPEEMLGLNWEGLDWFVEGEQLILVHDDPEPLGSIEVLLVEVPEGW